MTGSPIFIVGSPRSGTTLLRTLLNRHPAIALCGETHFFRLLYGERRRKAFGDLTHPANRLRLVREYVALQETREVFGADCAGLAERLSQEATGYPELLISMLKYYSELRGKARYGEKTPRHALYGETLCEWFPGASILHIVRDPRDVVASLLRMPFGSPSAVINARTWLRFNLAARRCSSRPQYLQVRYESLVEQPEPELARICKFIGEEYSPSMLTPEQLEVRDREGRDRAQSPVTTGRLGQWRDQLTQAQVAQIEWVAGPHLESFGYTAEARAASRMTVLRGASYAALIFARRTIPKLPTLWYHLLAPAEIAKYEESARRKRWTADEQRSSTEPR